MEQPVIPPAVTTGWKQHVLNVSKKKLLLATAFLAILVTMVANIGMLPLYSFLLSQQGKTVVLTENGISSTYTFNFGSLTRLTTLAGHETVKVEILQTQAYQNEGDAIVLAQADGQAGVILGILKKDGGFIPLVQDGTLKSDLAVRPDGIVLYTETINSVSRIIEARVTGYTAKTTDRGEGNNTRLAVDGSFIAITRAGLVRIDPAQPLAKSVSTIIPNSEAFAYGASLSKEGTQLILSDSSGKTLFYSIGRTHPAEISVTAERNQYFGPSASMVSQKYILVPDQDTVKVYKESGAFIGTVSVKN